MTNNTEGRRGHVRNLTYLDDLSTWGGIFLDLSQVKSLAEHWAVQVCSQNSDNHLERKKKMSHHICLWGWLTLLEKSLKCSVVVEAAATNKSLHTGTNNSSGQFRKKTHTHKQGGNSNCWDQKQGKTKGSNQPPSVDLSKPLSRFL